MRLIESGEVVSAWDTIRAHADNYSSPAYSRDLAFIGIAALRHGPSSIAVEVSKDVLRVTPVAFRATLSFCKRCFETGDAERASALAHHLASAFIDLGAQQTILTPQLRPLSALELGQSLQRMQFDELAIEVLRLALSECEPGSAADRCQVSLDLARSLRRQQFIDEAIDLLLPTLLVQNDKLLAIELSKLWFLKGSSDNALHVLSAAIEQCPGDADLHYERSRALFKMGQYSEAEKAISIARELDPRNSVYGQFAEIVTGTHNIFRGVHLPNVISRNSVASRIGRVLHILETSLPYGTTGYSYRTHYVLKEQKRLGLEPHPVTRLGFPEELDSSTPEVSDVVDGINYRRIKDPAFDSYNRVSLESWLQRYADRVARLAEEVQPEIVQATSSFKNGLVGLATAHAFGVPFVYELRGLWEESLVSKGAQDVNSERYIGTRQLETRCLSAADSVIAISQALASEIESRGVSSSRIFVVPNAVDPEQFPIKPRNEALAQSLNLGIGPVFGYVTSLYAYEGVDFLIHAFAEIRRAVPAARLLIVGDGEMLPQLRAIVKNLGLEESVLLPGRVAHAAVVDYYTLIDVFVVPRLPFRVCQIVPPLKPFEAMATGRALLVSDVQALRESIIHQETGVLFKAGDSASLIHEALSLAQSPERRTQLGRQAATWVREHRTWSAVSTKYLDAYNYARESSKQRLAASAIPSRANS